MLWYESTIVHIICISINMWGLTCFWCAEWWGWILIACKSEKVIWTSAVTPSSSWQLVSRSRTYSSKLQKYRWGGCALKFFHCRIILIHPIIVSDNQLLVTIQVVAFLLLNMFLNVSWCLHSISSSETVSEESLSSLLGKRDALLEELDYFLDNPSKLHGDGRSKTQLAYRVSTLIIMIIILLLFESSSSWWAMSFFRNM